jgi:ribonuclease P protein component
VHSRHHFPKQYRLLQRQDYRRVNRRKTRFVGQWIILDVLANHKSYSRLGLTVSRKYGKAHVRNRFKRIAREAFRLSREELPVGWDLNVRPRSRAQAAELRDVQAELKTLLKRARHEEERACQTKEALHGALPQQGF